MAAWLVSGAPGPNSASRLVGSKYTGRNSRPRSSSFLAFSSSCALTSHRASAASSCQSTSWARSLVARPNAATSSSLAISLGSRRLRALGSGSLVSDMVHSLFAGACYRYRGYGLTHNSILWEHDLHDWKQSTFGGNALRAADAEG